MKSLETLLDMARAKVHSDAELARTIGVERQALHEMRRGKRAISPETVTALCDVLQLPGDEAREWVAIALIANPKNASRAEMLKRALFAYWVAGVAILLTHATDAQANQWGRGNPIDAIYIVAHRVTFACLRALRRLWSMTSPNTAFQRAVAGW